MSSSSTQDWTCRGDDTPAHLPAELDFDFDLDGALDVTDCFSRTEAGPGAKQLVSAMPAADRAGVCAVCMEEYGPTEGKRTPCSHVYHAGCISDWLALEASCPLCRSVIGG